MGKKFDFCGWATRNNTKCSDGLTIMKDAFKDCDGLTVPLCWGHNHDDPSRVLGHALLENREDGVYTYCKFNDTEQGQNAKLLVEHGDVTALSIYANKLKKQGNFVMHGAIREVSLVLAGANPGAYIETVLAHGEEVEGEAIIYTGEELSLMHSDDGEPEPEQDPEADIQHADTSKQEGDEQMGGDISHADGEKTIKDVYESMNEEQKLACQAMVGMALEGDGSDDDNSEGGDDDMKHNIFDTEDMTQNDVLSHADQEAIVELAKNRSVGTLQDAISIYCEQNKDTLAHGIDEIETLFPEYKDVYPGAPEKLTRDMGWVSTVMNKTHKSPISRIRTRQADVRGEDLNALGYKKGDKKKLSANIKLLTRTTDPQTIYIKDALHRDDITDITDFDVVAYIKAEMRMMLDEEIARAILVGDGRSTSSDDKIPETNIRPIAKDEDLYTIKAPVAVAKDATEDANAKAFIRTVIKSRKEYKGSGSPTLFTTEDMLTNCLLLEDNNGRIIYDSVDKLATTLRVKEIVPVEVMEGVTRTVSSKNLPLMAILVNLNDYYVGADKGGAINMFDDFDIDYNQEKYLIETRISGALVKPYSAIAFELDKAQA